MPADDVVRFYFDSGNTVTDKNAPADLVAEGRLTIMHFIRVAREDFTGGGQQYHLLEAILRGSPMALDTAAVLTQSACADALLGRDAPVQYQMCLDWQGLATRMGEDDTYQDLIAHLPQCGDYRPEFVWRLVGWTILNRLTDLPCPELYYQYQDYCARHGNAPHRDYVLELQLTHTFTGDLQLTSLAYRSATSQDHHDIVLDIVSSPHIQL